ncbi:MAG TPA: RluA family pseudouridine synthase [Hellea balneolensis]|uniref:Pseudouridine synthase n=1 Tax=Hellea balneolensis TaxID=287478 RepID=A0A7C5M054_9PROT|nr:RluA family pseudouridine synthase [Hellea balneolensis]
MSSLKPSKARPFTYNPPSGLPEILYEDEHLLVVNKPAGLLSVPGKATDHKDCLESRLQNYCQSVRIVHRLDMATSGVMMLAKTASAHRHLGLQFERRHTRKTYIAVVAGHVSGPSGRIDIPLICDWPNRPLQMVDFEHGKRAITDWEIVEIKSEITRLRLYPLSGRSHQLRVHMLAIGHPILGDALYAPQEIYAASNRLCLHAESLEFRHPEGGAVHRFDAPCLF